LQKPPYGFRDMDFFKVHPTKAYLVS
jgi:hypothetical protein